MRDGLREIAAGELEMLGDEASIRRYLQTIGAWMSGDLELRMPGGPPGAEELDRFDAVVRDEAKVLLDACRPGRVPGDRRTRRDAATVGGGRRGEPAGRRSAPDIPCTTRE